MTSTRNALATPSVYHSKVDFVSNQEGKIYLAISPTDENT